MKISALLIFCVTLDLSWSQTFSTEKEYEILEKHLENYNVNHPHAGGADVYIQIRINSFGRLDAENMEFDLDITLRQKWNDSRLIYMDGDDYIIVQDPKMQARVWKPDTYFLNAREAQIHLVTMPNVLLRINKTGEVLYVIRMKLTIECTLDLHDYPLDNQRCRLILSSYSTTTDKLRYHWGSGTHFKMPRNQMIPQFNLYSNITEERTFNYSIGSFSGVQVSFTLRRLNGYHVLHIYIPTFLIVTISWVSFWIDPNAVPGRVTLGVTTILTLTTLATGVGYHLPPVSYVKAIDIWIAMCMAMVYASLLEFTLVNFIANKKIPADIINARVQQFEATRGVVAKLPTTYISQARAVDRLCRMIFPTSFFLFNLIYWPYYLLQLYSPSFTDFSPS